MHTDDQVRNQITHGSHNRLQIRRRRTLTLPRTFRRNVRIQLCPLVGAGIASQRTNPYANYSNSCAYITHPNRDVRETCEIALAKIEWDNSEEGKVHRAKESEQEEEGTQ